MIWPGTHTSRVVTPASRSSRELLPPHLLNGGESPLCSFPPSKQCPCWVLCLMMEPPASSVAEDAYFLSMSGWEGQ